MTMSEAMMIDHTLGDNFEDSLVPGSPSAQFNAGINNDYADVDEAIEEAPPAPQYVTGIDPDSCFSDEVLGTFQEWVDFTREGTSARCTRLEIDQSRNWYLDQDCEARVGSQG